MCFSGKINIWVDNYDLRHGLPQNEAWTIRRGHKTGYILNVEKQYKGKNLLSLS